MQMFVNYRVIVYRQDVLSAGWLDCCCLVNAGVTKVPNTFQVKRTQSDPSSTGKPDLCPYRGLSEVGRMV